MVLIFLHQVLFIIHFEWKSSIVLENTLLMQYIWYNRMWMIPNKKFNVNKRIQCKQNNFGEVKTNGRDFKMIQGGLSTPFIIVVQVSHVCHQADAFSPGRLHNPLLYAPFQHLYHRCLHLPNKITFVLIFDSFPFNLYDLQHSALHGHDCFVYIQYVCVFQFTFYVGSISLSIFESDLPFCWLMVKGVFNTVEHVFNSVHVGAPHWDREFCCPDSLHDLFCCLTILARITIL